MADVVIRGGNVMDGTGAAGFHADVAITDGRITEVGHVETRGKREIDADGLVVTPGFVDLHTHYDAQVMFDPVLSSSCWHGITTVVVANCGVGFAPVRPSGQDWLVRMLTGVEDIPQETLAEVMTWDWESFPEYMDSLSRFDRALDVAVQVPHAALRAYVMGERAPLEPATEEDIDAMVRILEEAMDAGSFGFSTGRLILHKALGGETIPGTFAEEGELFALGDVLKRCGRGLFQLVPGGFGTPNVEETFLTELDMMSRLAMETGRPVVYTMGPSPRHPHLWQSALERGAEAYEAHARLAAMFTCRPATATIIGIETPGTDSGPVSYLNPFRHRPTYKELLRLDDREAMVARLRDPAVKQRILTEAPAYANPEIGEGIAALMGGDRMFEGVYRLAEPVNYQFDPSQSVAALARASGLSVEECFYDMMIEDDGRRLFYVAGELAKDDEIRGAMTTPHTIPGLSDGGAHVQNQCDTSQTTSAMTHWARDREHGEKLSLEFVVKRLSADPASLGGLVDRGQIKVGMKADLNVIDFENLKVRAPRIVRDLPGDERRVIQRAEGYVATMVAGAVTLEHDEVTDERPGEVVRLNALKNAAS